MELSISSMTNTTRCQARSGENDGSGIPIFTNGYRREHGTEPKVTGNRKLSESDILSGMGAVSVKIDS